MQQIGILRAWSPSLPPRTTRIFLWLAICAACLSFRQVAVRLPRTSMEFPAIWDMSILYLWLWFEILHSVYLDNTSGDRGVALAIMFVFAGCALLYPDVAYGFLGFAIIALVYAYKDNKCARVLCYAFALILIAGVLTSSLCSGLHSDWAHIDAFVLWRSLALINVKAVIDGTILHMPGSDHSIIVEATCSSTWVLVLPVQCFLIVTLCRQGTVTMRDLSRLSILVALVFALNIFRLSQMLPSRDAWDYWHFGTGSSIFALACAVAVMITVRARNDTA